MLDYYMRIHHIFLPHKKNNFHPFALRPAGLAVFLALIITSQFAYNVFSAHQMQVLGYAIDINASDVSTISNQQRANAGLPALTVDSQLNNAALAKANDMFAKDYWAHNAPDGKTPWAFIKEAGYNYVTAGENLAMDFNTSNGVVSGWMGSPEHRANILNASYQDVGYAVVNGVLQGEQTTLVVAEYGSKPATPVAAVQPSSSSTPTTPQSATPQPTVSPSQDAADASASTPAPVAQSDEVAQVATQHDSEDQSHVKVQGTAAKAQGEVKGAVAPLPVKVYQSLNWGQKASIVLLSTLLLLFIMNHTLVWRQQKRGYKNIWLRAHPLGQAIVLSSVLVVTILSSIGTVL